MIPIRMDASLVTPLVKLLQKMTTASVMTATSQFYQEPKSAAPAPPAMYLTAVG